MAFAKGFTPQTCFWCGKESKKNNADKFSYSPCTNCKTNRFRTDKGILLIGVTDDPILDNQPVMKNIGYPTGRWAIMSDNIASHFNGGQNSMKKDRLGFVEDALLKDIMSKVKRTTK